MLLIISSALRLLATHEEEEVFTGFSFVESERECRLEATVERLCLLSHYKTTEELTLQAEIPCLIQHMIINLYEWKLLLFVLES